MSKISNLIFKNASHKVTSNYGWRKVISTSAGNTSSFHNGTDYGTYGKKLAQYAIEKGVILSCGTDKLGGKYVWVKYPRLNVKMLHYHLSSVNCKTGQSVSRGTLLGYTGKTGKATGIHLHLSIYDLSKGCYVNPEGFNYTDPSATNNTNTKPANRNYYMKGDKGEYIRHLCSWFADNYYGYFCKNKSTAHKLLDGNLFGPYLEKWVKKFQSNTGLAPDGKIGPLTQAKLRQYGFRY